jgi:hypothetical protein
VHRAAHPHVVFVERAEERELDDDSTATRLRDEILQPPKICRIPLGEIEFIAAGCVARCVTACPRRDQAAVGRRERVVGDVERRRIFAIGAGKRAREIEAVTRERIEILDVVEIEIEHRAVMLGGGDENRRLTAPEEVMRVVRMQPNRFSGAGGCRERERGEGNKEYFHDSQFAFPRALAALLNLSLITCHLSRQIGRPDCT